jgi:hypothetical protein
MAHGLVAPTALLDTRRLLENNSSLHFRICLPANSKGAALSLRETWLFNPKPRKISAKQLFCSNSPNPARHAALRLPNALHYPRPQDETTRFPG